MWMLANIWQPQGNRREKLVVLPEPKKVEPVTHSGYWERGAGPISRLQRTDNGIALPGFMTARDESDLDWRIGNLTNTEYQFWIGRPNKKDFFCMCRFCFAPLAGKEMRELHKKFGLKESEQHTSCMKRLQVGYKKIFNSGKCVVCNKHTRTRRWGIPMCEGEGQGTCTAIWMFTSRDYQQLDEVIGKLHERCMLRNPGR